jgi:branched-chain amino acid transport system permease protein
MPKAKTDQKTLLTAAIAVPLIIIFTSQLLEMSLGMALVLGVLILLRVLFADDRRVTIAVLVALLLWTIYLPLAHEENSEFLGIAVLILAYSVMALGLNIIVGYAGLLDLGYVAFFALGALTAGWFMSGFYSDAGKGGEGFSFLVSDPAASLPGIHLNFVIVVILAIIICAVAGMLIGLPTLRLRGDYIAIVTLAFGEIIGRIAVNSDDGILGIGHFNLTNGRAGITPVDKIDIPLVDRFTTLNLRPWYWTALALALVVLFINFRLRDSRIGRAWIAIREDEVAAVSMGIPTVRVKLLAYALGAAMGGMAGTFLGSFYNTVNADQFEFSFSIFVLAMIILGGLGSIWGVVLGALVLSFINTNLIPDVLNNVPGKVGLDFDLTELGFGIFGFLLVIMMVLRPQGLIPEKRHQAEFAEVLEGEEHDVIVETRI